MRLLAGLFAVTVTVTAAAAFVAPTADGSVDAALSVSWSDTSDRATVRAAFRDEFTSPVDLSAPDEPLIGWTGSIEPCARGETSSAWRDRALQRLNWYRNHAGVGNTVTEDADRLADAQAAALVMAANGRLSNDPPSSWRCWSQAGDRGASVSNLSLGSIGVHTIDRLFADEGNPSAGYRAWQFHSALTSAAVGHAPEPDTPALALTVAERGTPAPLREGSWYAWPPPGWTPHPLVFDRWSLYVPGARDMSGVDITASSGGRALPVEVHHDPAGYGDPNVSFVVDLSSLGWDRDWSIWGGPPPPGDLSVRLTATGVDATTAPRTISWTVRILSVNRRPTLTAFSAGTTTGQDGSEIVARVMALDPDGDPVRFRIGNAGDGAEATIDRYGRVRLPAGVPHHRRSRYEITVIGEDGRGGKATEQVTVPVIVSAVSAQHPYVTAAFRDFLGRDPSTADLDHWAPIVAAAGGRARLLHQLSTSDEWVGLVVDGLYRSTLGRAPEPAGLRYWIDRIRAGMTPATAGALFYASEEYYDRTGRTPESWVRDLYAEILGREPDAAGHDHWVGATHEHGRIFVAAWFYQSAESRGRRVDGLYRSLLAREPDPGGRAFWVEQLADGRDLALATHLASSTEYQHRAAARYATT